MRLYGLRGKLVLLVAVVAVPLVLYVAYQIYHLYDDLRIIAMENVRTGALVATADFDGFVHQMVEQGQSVGLAVLAEGRTRESSEEYLRSLGQHAPVSNFTILDTEGNIVASAREGTAGQFATLPEYRRVLGGAPYAVTPLRVNASGQPGFLTLAPVGQPIRGVVAVAVDAEDIGAVVKAEAREGGIVVVTDPTGRLAYTSAAASRGLRQGERLEEVPVVRDALEGGTGSSANVRLPGIETPLVGTQAGSTDTGWTIGYYRPRGDALRHVFRETLRAVAIVVAILGLAAVAGWWVSSGILTPVLRLTEAAKRVTAGDFETEIDVWADDEIGVLAEGLRDMQESVRHDFASMSELAAAGLRLNEATTTEDIAGAAAAHLIRLLRADACVITLFGTESRFFGEGTEDVHELSAEVRSRVPDEKLANRNYRLHMMDAPGERYPHGRFLVSLPLAVEGDVRGRADVIVAPQRTTPHFVRADVELAIGLAQQTAVALANAAHLATESKIADTLQDALLTPPFPIPNTRVGLTYRPATRGVRVGGDFYDFIKIGLRRYVLILGDISGHGLDAARHTMAAKGTLRSFALEDPSPPAAMQRANRVISEQLDPGSFVTAVFVLMDVESGLLRVTNAGHPPPFLLTGGGHAQSVLPLGGPPLGVAPDFPYGETVFHLQGGDTVVAFSDGLTDARNDRGDFFSEEGISAVLTRASGLEPSEIAAELAGAAEAHAGGHPGDDLAVLVFRWLRP